MGIGHRRWAIPEAEPPRCRPCINRSCLARYGAVWPCSKGKASLIGSGVWQPEQAGMSRDGTPVWAIDAPRVAAALAADDMAGRADAPVPVA